VKAATDRAGQRLLADGGICIPQAVPQQEVAYRGYEQTEHSHCNVGKQYGCQARNIEFRYAVIP
jgi:hypothetical protein